MLFVDGYSHLKKSTSFKNQVIYADIDIDEKKEVMVRNWYGHTIPKSEEKPENHTKAPVFYLDESDYFASRSLYPYQMTTNPFIPEEEPEQKKMYKDILKIQAKALGKTASEKIKVKKVLSLKKVKVKRSAKKLVLTATLKKVDGMCMKGKKIAFKFNGKKYSVKTNKKGVAKLIIKKSQLKKLKAGKKVKYQATYIKSTVKYTVKVAK